MEKQKEDKFLVQKEDFFKFVFINKLWDHTQNGPSHKVLSIIQSR